MVARFSRLVALDAYLSSGTYPSAERLAKLLSVAKRTIYLDLKELKTRFNRDVRFDREKGGYFLTGDARPLPQITPTEADLALLSAATRFAGALCGPGTRSILTILLTGICGAQYAVIDERLEYFLNFPQNSDSFGEIFMQVLIACAEETFLSVELKNGQQIDFDELTSLTPTVDGWMLQGITENGAVVRKVVLEDIVRTSSNLRDMQLIPVHSL